MVHRSWWAGAAVTCLCAGYHALVGNVSLRGIVTFIVVVFANGVGAARYFKHLAPSLSASETVGRDIPATTEGEGWEDCEVPMDALLLDYMLCQCCPPPGSGLSLSDEQQSAVYHEGPGGSRGAPPKYWLHRWHQNTTVRPNRSRKQRTRVGDTWITPDETKFTTQAPVLRLFYELGGYRCFPDVVTVEVVVTELLDVDTTNGTFTVQFTLTTRWFDPYYHAPAFSKANGLKVLSRTVPFLTLESVVPCDGNRGVPGDNEETDEDGRHVGEVTLMGGNDPPGVLSNTRAITAKLRDDNAAARDNGGSTALKRFPFDTASLNIVFMLTGAGSPGNIDCSRVLLPLSVEQNLNHKPHDWDVLAMSATSREPRGQLQRLYVSINLERRYEYFVYRVFLPLGAIALLNLCACAFDISPSPGAEVPESDELRDRLNEAYGHRTGMLLAILFAGITYQSFVTDVLPRVPYMTCADKFVLLCLSASVSYTRVKSIQRLSVTILCHVAGVRSVRDVFSLQISHFCSLFLLPQVLDSRPRIYLVVRRTSCCKSRLDVQPKVHSEDGPWYSYCDCSCGLFWNCHFVLEVRTIWCTLASCLERQPRFQEDQD
eukprot:m.348002 g.348002  ORF g.348002 m.348002 type:complete len:601 (+) comp16562_c0_seq16:66-1868(+)